MKIGDLVIVHPRFLSMTEGEITGVVVGFNEKGEGGKDFVHVLVDGSVHIFMEFDLKVIKTRK